MARLHVPQFPGRPNQKNGKLGIKFVSYRGKSKSHPSSKTLDNIINGWKTFYENHGLSSEVRM